MAEGQPRRGPRQEPAARCRGTAAVHAPLHLHDKESVMKTYDPDKSDTEVRQASPRRMNARVLVTSLIGVIVLFAIIYLIYTLTQANPT
jgi:uncharacterized membrane protein YdbT with pleckstrin-like domain